MEFQIADKTIENDHPVFFIAEAESTTMVLLTVKELIDIAVEAEVDAVKFQTFKARDDHKDAPADYHIQHLGTIINRLGMICKTKGRLKCLRN